MSKTKHNKKFIFKLNNEMYEEISNFAKDTNMSKASAVRLFVDYYFQNQDNEKIFYRDTNFKKELIYELRRYGNNLNQIAYKLNVALKTEKISPSDKLEIKEAINQIDRISKTISDLNNLVNKRL